MDLIEQFNMWVQYCWEFKCNLEHIDPNASNELYELHKRLYEEAMSERERLRILCFGDLS